MDYEALRFWFDVFQLLLTGVVAVYVWLTSRHRVTTSAIRKLEEDVDQRLDNQGDRLTRVEQVVESLPRHKDIGQVYDRLNALHGQLQKLTGTVGGVARQLELVNDHLLNRGGKR